jgi:hypothetical protein
MQFSHWTASPAVIFDNANWAITTFTMPANAVTVTANFEPIPDSISAGNGSVSVDYTESGGAVTLDLPGSKVTEIIDSVNDGGI